MRRIILREGRLIDPIQQVDTVADLVISDGRIHDMDLPGRIPSDPSFTELIVRGCWVVPGLCDPHVHLRDPGFPDKETIPDGLQSAARGGFVTVAAMANTEPVNDNPEVTRYMLGRAAGTQGASLVPVSAVTKRLEGKELVDFERMTAAGARMFSDDGESIDDTEVLRIALRKAKAVGARISLHEEDRMLSGGRGINDGLVARKLGLRGYPPKAETVRLARDLEIALQENTPVHIAHVSCADSLNLIRRARELGLAVTCEVTPHHFSLDESAVLTWGTYAKMSPPLRERHDVDKLVEGLADGTIDMIASDHAPHDDRSKQLEQISHKPGEDSLPQPLSPEAAQAFERATKGIIGLETALALALELVHKGRITPMRLVELMAVSPAALLQLEARTLRKGAPANITVIDPDREWQLQIGQLRSRSHNTPFLGRVCRGKAVLTIVDGRIVYNELTERLTQ